MTDSNVTNYSFAWHPAGVGYALSVFDPKTNFTYMRTVLKSAASQFGIG